MGPHRSPTSQFRLLPLTTPTTRSRLDPIHPLSCTGETAPAVGRVGEEWGVVSPRKIRPAGRLESRSPRPSTTPSATLSMSASVGRCGWTNMALPLFSSACCNRIQRLPTRLLSRFLSYQYVRVCPNSNFSSTTPAQTRTQVRNSIATTYFYECIICIITRPKTGKLTISPLDLTWESCIGTRAACWGSYQQARLGPAPIPWSGPFQQPLQTGGCHPCWHA